MNSQHVIPSDALALRPVAVNAKEADGISYWDNSHPRAPLAVICDTSISMAGPALGELQRGLALLFASIAGDDLASLRVDGTVIRCGGTVETIVPFGAVEPGATPVIPPLVAGGQTPLGQAVRHAIASINARRAEYRRCALASFRPLVVIESDGAPNDENWEAAAAELRALAERGWSVVAVGVGPHADLATLQKFCVLPVRRLEATNLTDLFKWVSDSMRAVSRSQSAGTTGVTLPEFLPEVPKL